MFSLVRTDAALPAGLRRRGVDAEQVSRPMKVTSDMTSSSRIGSIGGFVTRAKQLAEVDRFGLCSTAPADRRRCPSSRWPLRRWTTIGARMTFEVFLRIAERLLAIQQRNCRFVGGRRFGQVFQRNARGFDPFAIRLGAREFVLQLLVVNDATLLEIDQQHLARLQAPL